MSGRKHARTLGCSVAASMSAGRFSDPWQSNGQEYAPRPQQIHRNASLNWESCLTDNEPSARMAGKRSECKSLLTASPSSMLSSGFRVGFVLILHITGIKLDERAQLIHHPRHCDIGKLRIFIAASGVGMNSGEPYLLEIRLIRLL